MDEPEILDLQYARVGQPFGDDPPKVHCPICGDAALKKIKGKCKIAPCEHVKFIYIGGNEDFSYESEDFKKKFKDSKKKSQLFDGEELNSAAFRKFLLKSGYKNNLLAIEISYGGGNGGCCFFFTDVYGFDYGSLDEEEEC